MHKCQASCYISPNQEISTILKVIQALSTSSAAGQTRSGQWRYMDIDTKLEIEYGVTSYFPPCLRRPVAYFYQSVG